MRSLLDIGSTVAWRLPCGHVAAVTGSTDVADIARTFCPACLRERLEAEASEPAWHRAERERASHFDGFTWRCDPPTDEGFKIPQMGDTAAA